MKSKNNFRYKFSDPLRILQLYPQDLSLHLRREFEKFKRRCLHIIHLLPHGTEVSFILPGPRVKKEVKDTIKSNLALYFFYCQMKNFKIGRIIDPFFDAWIHGVAGLLYTNHFHIRERSIPFQYKYGAVHLSDETYQYINELIIQ